MNSVARNASMNNVSESKLDFIFLIILYCFVSSIYRNVTVLKRIIRKAVLRKTNMFKKIYG